MTTMTRNTQPLSNDQLFKSAPSIFAAQPWKEMSSKYAFIPTIEIVEKMRAEGFQPVAVAQSNTRIEGKQDFTKHVIRFRDFRNGDVPAVRTLGMIFPEVIVTNSHDGASTYQLDAGLFRLACLNGLVVAEGNLSQIKVRHTGNPDGIIDATYQVVDEFPKVIEAVKEFSEVRLTAPQQLAYATAALELRYEAGEAPIRAEQIIRPRRAEDRDATLWNTFNVVQENLVNGGVRGNNPETQRRLKTRAVTGISENARLNKALWTLTTEMKKLVA